MLIFIFTNPGNSNLINDNHYVDPTYVKILPAQLDPNASQKSSLVVSFQVLDNLGPQTLIRPVCVLRTAVEKTVNLDVSCHVVTVAHFAHISRHPQKKGLSPDLLLREIKHVKSVSCVTLYRFAHLVSRAPNVVNELSVGGRLQKFGKHGRNWLRIQGWSPF